MATPLNRFTASLRDQAQRLTRRERWALRTTGGVLGLVAVWGLGWAPAWQTAQTAPARLAQALAEQQRVQSLAQEAQVLRQQDPPPRVSPDVRWSGLQALTRQHLGPNGQLERLGQAVQVRLQAVPGAALALWLHQVRLQWQLRPEQAQLKQLPDRPGHWQGELVFALEP